jgi:hypothetical protein
MNVRRISSKNTTAVYLIVFIVILIAFLLLGGGTWLKGLTHGGRSMSFANWNWVQILISLVIGFLLGLLASRRR